MKINFTNEDFEKFIKQQADQLRMRPSDKVWDNISGEMHTKRRWIGLALLFFLISATSVSTWIYLSNRTHGEQHASLNRQTVTASHNEHTLATSGSSHQTQAISENKSTGNIAMQTAPKRNPLLIHGLSVASSLTFNNPASTTQTESLNGLPVAYTLPVFEGTFADSDPVGETKTVTEAVKSQDHEPLSIESVINKYRGQRSKLSWQFYFTPTISYRKLTENKSYLRKVQQQPTNSTMINYAELYNINDVVTHRPDIGMELGVAAKYELGKRVKLRAGLQFNLSHYDIKAFDVYTPQVATIALNAGNRIDSINTVTKYRNMGGPSTSWLQNFYYQISAPVGVDVVLSRGRNVQFGVSTTIQPTYVLGERAYMISSDYQNYTKVPWLMRKWNVNTSLETFVSYSTGQLKWQVGPQVRYQLLSSFVNQYPVKENLFDFGLKVGIGLNK